MRFRLHRGSLADSMATMVVLDATEGALVEHIRRQPPRGFYAGEIKVEKYAGADERIGWPETYVVKDVYGVVGFTDEMPAS